VQLKGQLLTVRGEKLQDTTRKDESFYRVERAYGSFVRTLQLPTSVREDKVNATFKNGLLTITLTKVPEAVGTTIPIKMI
jgi:HSP20 family protein